MTYSPSNPPSTLEPELQRYLIQELRRIASELGLGGGGESGDCGDYLPLAGGTMLGDIDVPQVSSALNFIGEISGASMAFSADEFNGVAVLRSDPIAPANGNWLVWESDSILGLEVVIANGQIQVSRDGEIGREVMRIAQYPNHIPLNGTIFASCTVSTNQAGDPTIETQNGQIVSIEKDNVGQGAGDFYRLFYTPLDASPSVQNTMPFINCNRDGDSNTYPGGLNAGPFNVLARVASGQSITFQVFNNTGGTETENLVFHININAMNG